MKNEINIERKISIIDRLDNSRKNRIIFLSVLVILALVVRLYIFPLDVPFFNDAQSYFWYAVDTNLLNQFPPGHSLTNNGWPIFVSIFFQLTDSNNFLDYQNIQRFMGVIFSVATIFPVYLLCTRFVKKSYSLLGATLFIFEPRLIQNSSIGTPESMYIFLIASLIALFLSTNFKKIYLAFLIAGLISLVRYEGILIILPLTIMFFVRFRSRRNDLLKYIICIMIFSLIVIPVAYMKNESMGQDGFVSHISAGPKYYQATIQENNSSIMDFLQKGIINMAKFLGWIQIPSFLIFVPVGIIFFLKKIDYKKMTIILTVIIILLPAFYAYSRDFADTKYLYALFPIFSLLGCFTFEKIFRKYNKKNLIFCLIFMGIILSSTIFISWKSVDNEHYRETYQILSEISKKDMMINVDFGKYGNEITYFHWTRLNHVEDFPILKMSLPENIVNHVKRQYIEKAGITSFDEYLILLKKQNVTHLLIDETNAIRLINDDLRGQLVYVFHNEQEFPFLTKEYDSRENGFTYHLKLFKINFDKISGNG